jgi:hypothetical protein
MRDQAVPKPEALEWTPETPPVRIQSWPKIVTGVSKFLKVST